MRTICPGNFAQIAAAALTCMLLTVATVRADEIKVVSTAFLGLTVGCAQCHDHRYDPIPQTDYYRLRAVFEITEEQACSFGHRVIKGRELPAVDGILDGGFQVGG